MVGYILLLRTPPPLPNIDINAWWGPGNETKQDTSIRPFEVQFSDMMIQDLKKRLKKHRIWTPPLETIDFQYGFNTDQLDSWVSYWAEKYNFKGREKFFNKFPHYKTNIQGLDIHFIRVQPEVPAGVEIVPVLFLHTWPGSVREYYEALPLLTTFSENRDFAIEAIVPSWPGCGFSDAPARSGLGTAEMAVVLRNLMHRLGFKKFYLQGGDIIGISLATLFPQEVLGFHSNVGASASISAILLNLIGAWLPSFVVEPHLAHRMYPLSSTFGFLLEESGYVHLQATKPDTLGLAISDSPIGLLAYILEKFSTWTKSEYKHLPDGGLDKHWSRDQLLDNLMCYWATNSFTTSVRMYAEIFSLRQIGLQMDEIPTPVPTWIIQAKNELIFQPWRILRIKFPNLIHTNAIEDGGHFLAFQLPKVFSEDVLKAVSAFRKQKKENTEL
ncbi:juvenile hormone epoxide hydrolase-like isoform X2 [Leguminivora glycinivorella]|uniref:juvenile hormone epoxide hydrolase-like isoform X2 n=1 Tax=Leguminivora glycinivorella TaxID=1035111 RepID=UPI00200D0CE8|nr:juvenile hormone epoxide hydrolase-like isoform X2 [Leguminivora glycinivorella]